MKAYQAISQANCKMITKCLLCQWSMLWVQFISFNSLLVGFLFAKMHHTGGGVYMMGWGLLVHTRCDVWVMRASEDCGRRGLKPVANLTPDNPRWSPACPPKYFLHPHFCSLSIYLSGYCDYLVQLLHSQPTAPETPTRRSAANMGETNNCRC